MGYFKRIYLSTYGERNLKIQTHSPKYMNILNNSIHYNYLLSCFMIIHLCQTIAYYVMLYVYLSCFCYMTNKILIHLCQTIAYYVMLYVYLSCFCYMTNIILCHVICVFKLFLLYDKQLFLIERNSECFIAMNRDENATRRVACST